MIHFPIHQESIDGSIVLIKLDGQAQVVGSQIIEVGRHFMAGRLVRHPGGGYLVAISVQRNNQGQFDIRLIKTDNQGLVSD